MTTRFPGGITTVTKSSPLGMFGLPDPTEWHVFFDDFDTYTAAQWTVTETGDGTQALTDIDGGALLITTAALDNDAVFMQKVGESFLLATGKKSFFKARFKVAKSTQSDFQIGLIVTDTTPLDATDGIYFQKDDGDQNLDIICRKNATTGSTTAVAGTVADNTFLTVAWYYDGAGNLSYFVDDVKKGTLDASSSYLPDTELTVSFGFVNGEAGATTLTLDYVFAAKQR